LYEESGERRASQDRLAYNHMPPGRGKAVRAALSSRLLTLPPNVSTA
jgi:hypothetical protein